MEYKYGVKINVYKPVFEYKDDSWPESERDKSSNIKALKGVNII